MRLQLPSMISLCCFEATARHLSVTLAAEELSLTQSAVSRQVKNLEEMLGCELFHRVRQRLQLTDTGRNYAQEVSLLLNQLKAATSLARCGSGGKLHIGVEPSFNTRWLLPKLGDFIARYPHIEVELMNDLRRLYERHEGFDIGILYGNGNWAGFDSHFLIQGELLAVCTPELLEHYGPIVELTDILRYPLLHHDAYATSSQLSSTWLWLHAAGLSNDEIEALPGQHFEHFRFVLDAALHGLGVSVLPAYLVAGELAEGRLVAASRKPLICGAYYVATRRQRAREPEVQALANWLLQSAEMPEEN